MTLNGIVHPFTPTSRNQSINNDCSSPKEKDKAIPNTKAFEKKLLFDEVESLKSFQKTSCQMMTVLPAEREYRFRDPNPLDDFGFFWEVDNALYSAADQKELDVGFGQRGRKGYDEGFGEHQNFFSEAEDLKLEVPYGTSFDSNYYNGEQYACNSYQTQVYPELSLSDNLDEMEKVFMGELACNLQQPRREIKKNFQKPEVHPPTNKKRQRKTALVGNAAPIVAETMNSKRRRRCNEWTPEEVVLLLNCTKILVNFELKTISQALFHCIKRNPGKCWGRAAEKKLKRMKIFDNWKTCNKETVVKRINEELITFGEKGKYLDPELVSITKKIMQEAEEQSRACGQIL